MAKRPQLFSILPPVACRRPVGQPAWGAVLATPSAHPGPAGNTVRKYEADTLRPQERPQERVRGGPQRPQLLHAGRRGEPGGHQRDGGDREASVPGAEGSGGGPRRAGDSEEDWPQRQALCQPGLGALSPGDSWASPPCSSQARPSHLSSSATYRPGVPGARKHTCPGGPLWVPGPQAMQGELSTPARLEPTLPRVGGLHTALPLVPLQAGVGPDRVVAVRTAVTCPGDGGGSSSLCLPLPGPCLEGAGCSAALRICVSFGSALGSSSVSTCQVNSVHLWLLQAVRAATHP